MKLKYAIIGVGGLGGYYGGKLAHNGEDVHFLLHSDYQYVKENGLRIDSIDGKFALPKVNAYANQSEMPKCDIILVCLKTTNNYLLKTILPPIMHNESIVILVQNGLGIEADLASSFPEANIAGGLAFICSAKIGPGCIAHLDYGALNIGSYSCKNADMLKQVVSDFVTAGVKAHLVDLDSARWKKLLWNIPYNGLTVVMNDQTDKLTLQTDTRNLIRAMMHEVRIAANTNGLKEPISEEMVEKMIEYTEAMTPYSPSMKLDYDAHRPLEIEYIYTRPLEAAQKAGVEMARVSMLEQQLKFLNDSNLRRNKL